MISIFLQKTGMANLLARPPVVCTDGFELSVQASKNHYCCPRVDNAICYTKVEVGFPSEAIPDVLELEDGTCLNFAQYRDGDSGDIYGYIPTWYIDALVIVHGGIANMPD